MSEEKTRAVLLDGPPDPTYTDVRVDKKRIEVTRTYLTKDLSVVRVFKGTYVDSLELDEEGRRVFYLEEETDE